MAENENNVANETTDVVQTETQTKADDIESLKAEIEALKSEKAKIKDAMDRSCSETARYKKELRAKQSESEVAEAERLEREKAMQEELESYRVKDRINNYSNKLVANGYDIDTAQTMAASLPDGIDDSFFTAQKSFIDKMSKDIETKLLSKQPGLSSGKAITSDDVQKAEMDKLRGYFGLK